MLILCKLTSDYFIMFKSEKNREENSLNHFAFGHVEVEPSSLIFILKKNGLQELDCKKIRRSATTNK